MNNHKFVFPPMVRAQSLKFGETAIEVYFATESANAAPMQKLVPFSKQLKTHWFSNSFMDAHSFVGHRKTGSVV